MLRILIVVGLSVLTWVAQGALEKSENQFGRGVIGSKNLRQEEKSDQFLRAMEVTTKEELLGICRGDCDYDSVC